MTCGLMWMPASRNNAQNDCGLLVDTYADHKGCL